MSEQVMVFVVAALGGIIAAVLTAILARRFAGGASNPARLYDIVSRQFRDLADQIDRRMKEHVHAINESKEFLANRVSSAERTVRTVSLELGKLESATSALQKTSNEIATFQHMLKSPRVRGSFGEVLLGNLMSEVLPGERYETQYRFRRNGEVVDAIIRLQDGYIVAVDAKFPLAHYSIQGEEERTLFMRDVKTHIRDIAQKYIVPDEHTLDYAFMYIPVESVYYETMIHDKQGGKLWDFCLSSKVIPVSPNSFLAYLQTVLVGLKGMKVEEQTREILQYLGRLNVDFKRFAEGFSTIGVHISNAKNRYEDSARHLDRLAYGLQSIGREESQKIPPPEQGS